MAFDPTKPTNNSPISSAELRSQLTSLKTLIDSCPTTPVMVNYVQTNTSGSALSVSGLDMLVQDPPTAQQVQEIADKLDELIDVLRRGQ